MNPDPMMQNESLQDLEKCFQMHLHESPETDYCFRGCHYMGGSSLAHADLACSHHLQWWSHQLLAWNLLEYWMM